MNSNFVEFPGMRRYRRSPEILTLREAAGLAGLSVSALYRHIRAGTLPAERSYGYQNRAWTVKRSDVLARVWEREEGRPLLTARMLDVLRWIAGGATVAQIARRLGVTDRTVTSYLSAIRARLGAVSTAQALLFAEHAGLL